MMKLILAATLLILLSACSLAQTQPNIKACLGLTDSSVRLACYDQQAGQEPMLGLPASPADTALSRSWNGVYGSIGVERGDATMSLWLEHQLVTGPNQSNDNPDIIDYLGRVEAQATWSPGRSTAAVLWRPFLKGRGLIQLDWTYPVSQMDCAATFSSSMDLGLTLFKF